MSKSGESTNTINPQVARSVAASATVATCSTGGLTIESCASYLERASRFIGVSTGSYIKDGKTDLNKIWSQMDSIFLEDKLKNHQVQMTGVFLDLKRKVLQALRIMLKALSMKMNLEIK